MKPLLLFLCLVGLISCAQEDPRAKWADYEHLIGLWRFGETDNYEEWWYNKGDSLVGRSFTLRSEGDTGVWERLLLAEKEGEIYYFALLPGPDDAPAAFKLIEKNEFTLMFEDLKNEFPNRILYEKIKDGEMKVTLASAYESDRRIQINMVRVR